LSDGVASSSESFSGPTIRQPSDASLSGSRLNQHSRPPSGFSFLGSSMTNPIEFRSGFCTRSRRFQPARSGRPSSVPIALSDEQTIRLLQKNLNASSENICTGRTSSASQKRKVCAA